MRAITYTPKQLEAMRFIAARRKETGVSPTLDEVADHMSISKATAFGHIEALVKKGAVVKTRNEARSLELLDPAFFDGEHVPAGVTTSVVREARCHSCTGTAEVALHLRLVGGAQLVTCSDCLRGYLNVLTRADKPAQEPDKLKTCARCNRTITEENEEEFCDTCSEEGCAACLPGHYAETEHGE